MALRTITVDDYRPALAGETSEGKKLTFKLATSGVPLLTKLLELLPPKDADGWVVEMHKVTNTEWYIAKNNIYTNKMEFSNVGKTPEEAIMKMLHRLGILKAVEDK